MTTYPDHNDSEGRAIRLLAQASNADRARMLAVLQERDLGCVTLCMPAAEVYARRGQAWYLHMAGPRCVTSFEHSVRLYHERRNGRQS